MSTYRAPLAEMQFVLNELAGLEQVSKLPGFEEAAPDVVSAILDEAAKFATDVLDPLNWSGDQEGAERRDDGTVKTPAGFRDAYWKFCENGWNGLSKSPDHGGQGLPQIVATAVEEMWHSSNMAFDLCPLLTQGAIEALELVGTDEQKARFLPKMVSGEWTGTMNLTEPQAGSDLAAVRTKAVKQGDGSYRIHGNKIFITYGDHDYTENIIHLVLARTPDAPEGVKGISLFVVPKVLVNDDGSLGAQQRRQVRVDRAQARHPREPHLRDGLRRQGRRGRLSGRRGEPRPRVHVHHDEPGALLGRHGGRGHRRARLPARRRLRPRPRAGQGGRPRQGGEGRADHRAPGRAADADDDARPHRGAARRRVRHGLRDGPRAPPRRTRRRARRTRPSST